MWVSSIKDGNTQLMEHIDYTNIIKREEKDLSVY
jgi:hypothetical protein